MGVCENLLKHGIAEFIFDFNLVNQLIMLYQASS